MLVAMEKYHAHKVGDVLGAGSGTGVGSRGGDALICVALYTH